MGLLEDGFDCPGISGLIRYRINNDMLRAFSIFNGAHVLFSFYA
jgi:hypothetical protein